MHIINISRGIFGGPAREVMLVDGEMTYSWEQEGRNHRGHVAAPVARRIESKVFEVNLDKLQFAPVVLGILRS